MNSLKDCHQGDDHATNGDTPDAFRRKLFSSRQCLWPRRYVMALLLFFLLLIRAWRNVNVMFTLTHALILGEMAHVKYPSIGNWTIDEINNYSKATSAAELLAHIPGCLLIFKFSSHKYILFSIIATSTLQMLTPVCLQHHSASLLVVLLSQTIIEAPIRTAVISAWRDWAPPLERTKLIIFSIFGYLLGCAATPLYAFLFNYFASSESFYFSGIAGLTWALFWYNITSETPQNDPLISEQELQYLEGNIPMCIQEKIELKDVPWKSILTSKQILMLCLIFFKMACSIQAILTCGTLFGIHLSDNYNPLIIFLLFCLAFIVIIPSSAILADCLIRRLRGRILLIRKCFLCGGFTLQNVFMMGTLAASDLTQAIFYMLSYLCFIASLPGFITLPMDLSPRYVAIIAGYVYVFYITGFIAFQYLAEMILDVFQLDTVFWLFLCDGAISLICVALFAIWGDVEEQLWSLTNRRASRANGYRSYPKPEEQDDMNLVTEHV